MAVTETGRRSASDGSEMQIPPAQMFRVPAVGTVHSDGDGPISFPVASTCSYRCSFGPDFGAVTRHPLPPLATATIHCSPGSLLGPPTPFPTVSTLCTRRPSSIRKG